MASVDMGAEEESGQSRSRISFLPRCVVGRPELSQDSLWASLCLALAFLAFHARPRVFAALGCLVGSLAFWAAHGGDPLTWKRPGSRLSELAEVWAPAALDVEKLEPEVKDDGMLGIPFIESMPEEPLPEYDHVKKEEVELGISQLAVARVDCWNPCDRKARFASQMFLTVCVKRAAACLQAGWCHWCGRGRACCRRGADDPAECRGFGGSWRPCTGRRGA